MHANKQKNLLRLVESGLMLAIATVLSMVKVLDLPYGGSVTAFSALPILLVAYRHGVWQGLLTAFAHALIQLILGANTLSYATSASAAVAIVVLDYLLAFTVLGLGGIFRRRCDSQGVTLVLGAVLTGALRYALHTIAGCTVWAGLSIPTEAALVYSLAYNATYMLPETLVTALGAWYLSKAVDLRETMPTRAKQTAKSGSFVLSLVGKAALLTAAVWDVVEIFRPLQDAETGDFIITNLTLVDWWQVAVVTAAGVLVWGVCTAIGRRSASRS
ncbi:MAG: energy-coupled thiamine transporter ThiT [Clostridia bacterium]|nr:energy-coupled thiamine transporter ThiT [Clostridia bacterium]